MLACRHLYALRHCESVSLLIKMSAIYVLAIGNYLNKQESKLNSLSKTLWHEGWNGFLHLSFTKATFSLGLLFAYNHSRKPPLVDDAHLLVAGALVLTFWTLFLRATDPFTLPQSLTWRVVTSLSFPPPNRPGINTVTEDDGKEEDKEHLKKD